MSHPFIGRRILVITAHPDDEAYLCAGATHQNAAAGGTTMLVCATLGGKGSSHLKRRVSAAVLKRIRRRELAAATASAGFHEVYSLGLPDGGIANLHSRFFALTLPHARRFAPDVVLTFGENGITGHDDHITCWKVGKRVARMLKIPLYVFTYPRSIARSAPTWLIQRRSNPHYQAIMPYPVPTVILRCSPKKKLSVLRHYASQLEKNDPFHGFPKHAVRMVTRAEYFARSR